MRFYRFFWLGLAILVVAETRVYAYTDPGSGTLILQILLAAFFGLMFYIRRIIAWVRSKVLPRSSAPEEDGATAGTEEIQP